jgi:hypothetical protein
MDAVVAAMDRQSEALRDLTAAYKHSTRNVPKLVVLGFLQALGLIATIVTIVVVLVTLHRVESQTSPAVHKATAAEISAIQRNVELCTANIIIRDRDQSKHLPIAALVHGCPNVLKTSSGPATTVAR